MVAATWERFESDGSSACAEALGSTRWEAKPDNMSLEADKAFSRAYALRAPALPQSLQLNSGSLSGQ